MIQDILGELMSPETLQNATKDNDRHSQTSLSTLDAVSRLFYYWLQIEYKDCILQRTAILFFDSAKESFTGAIRIGSVDSTS